MSFCGKQPKGRDPPTGSWKVLRRKTMDAKEIACQLSMTEGAPQKKFDSRSADGAGVTTSPASRSTGRSRASQDPPMPTTGSAQLLNPADITGDQ